MVDHSLEACKLDRKDGKECHEEDQNHWDLDQDLAASKNSKGFKVVEKDIKDQSADLADAPDRVCVETGRVDHCIDKWMTSDSILY